MELSTAEVAEAWLSHSEDVLVNDDGDAYYCGRRIVCALDGSPNWRAIKDWCNGQHYWPNVWTVNDHGNVELHDVDGNSYGGLV